MKHRPTWGAAVGACLLSFTASRAQAQTFDFSWLSCFTSSETTVSPVTWGPSDPQILKVGAWYDDDDHCHYFIADVKVTADTGANVPNTALNQPFTFDSISNDPIDTEYECESYRQSTAIFRKHAGTWSIVGGGQLRGTWVGSHCAFAPPPGESNFTQKKFFPPSSGYDRFRVASRVTTGPSDSPYVRTVCIGGRFADIQGVPRKACANP